MNDCILQENINMHNGPSPAIAHTSSAKPISDCNDKSRLETQPEDSPTMGLTATAGTIHLSVPTVEVGPLPRGLLTVNCAPNLLE